MSSIESALSSVQAAKDSAVKTQIGFAIASKQLKAQQQQGEAVNQLLEAAAQLSRAVGKGVGFDGIA